MKPISPKNSRDYEALVQIAGAQLGDEVRSFLSEIDAPSNLKALFLVCNNVRDALNEARSAWGLSSAISALNSWDRPLTWLLSKSVANVSAVASGSTAPSSTNGRHPLWGWGLQRFPVYSALWNSPKNNVRLAEYRLLQAHLMLANALLMRKHAPVAFYESYEGEEEILSNYARSSSAAFAVRLISLKPAYLPTLATSMQPQQFARHCRSLADGPSGQITVNVPTGGIANSHTSHTFDAVDLAVFLEKALGEREQWTSESSSHYGPGNRLWVSGGISDFDFLVLNSGDEVFDHSPQDKKHTSRKRFSVNRQSADNLLDLDDDPLEDEDGEEADDTDLGRLKKDEEPGDYQEVTTSWANHVEMANQQFPWTFGSLVPEELNDLLVVQPAKLLSAVKTGSLTPKERLDLEILALIQVMFWTGSSIERARNLRVVKRFTPRQDDELLLNLATSKKCAWWRIRAPLPEYSREQTPPEKGVDRKRTSYLTLPDVTGGSELISALLKLPRSAATSVKAGKIYDPTRVFHFTRRQYRDRVNWLGLSSGCDSRLTPERIGKCMVQRVLQQSRGDSSATAIVTGNDLNLATVRLFYACRSVRTLQCLYMNSALSLYREFERTARQDFRREVRRQNVNLAKPSLYIGNRICPTLRSLRGAVNRLITEIHACEERKRENDAIDHHNLFTLYTIWFFSYTTGIRGIRTPYLPIAEIDHESGLATITDKDNGLGYRTKLTWISPDLIKQMDSYQDFLSRSLRFPKDDADPIINRSTALGRKALGHASS